MSVNTPKKRKFSEVTDENDPEPNHSSLQILARAPLTTIVGFLNSRSSPQKKQKNTNVNFITSSPLPKKSQDKPIISIKNSVDLSEETEPNSSKSTFIEILLSPMFKQILDNSPDAEEEEGLSIEDEPQNTSEISPSIVDEEESSESEEFDPWLFIRGLPVDPPNTGLSLSPILPPKEDDRPTLVLDLDETLVHCRLEKSENPDLIVTVPFLGTDYEVAVYKRPHFAEFLRFASVLFEVVIFTASQQVYADKLLDQLDPQGHISYRLFRDSCVMVQGNYLKDLSVLGRDLAKTVIVDNSPHVFGFQLDNGIPIETWFANNEDDSELLKLIPFLESLVEVNDVRPLVREHFQLYKKVGSVK